MSKTEVFSVSSRVRRCKRLWRMYRTVQAMTNATTRIVSIMGRHPGAPLPHPYNPRRPTTVPTRTGRRVVPRLGLAPSGRQALLSVIQEGPEFAAPARMLQLPQRLRLDLAGALARHRELLADLFEGMIGVHTDAEAHTQYALFAWRERRQHPSRCLAQIRLDCCVDRQDRVLVFDEIAEMRILLVADRRFERERLLGDLENLADFL